MPDVRRSRKTWVDPLTRPVIAANVPASGVDVRVDVTDAERAALAEALDLAGVDELHADFRLSRRSGGEVRVAGRLRGAVRPVCVLTLEPFPLLVDEAVEMTFADAPRGEREEEGGEIDLGSASEPPDPIENGVIDLGRVVTEFLSLAIPPFPRKPGAELGEAAPETAQSPFAALGKLGRPKD